jgi:hypothetical protein
MFGHAHGAIRWLAADAVSTVYTVSGLTFQPKALRFYWQGHGSATDAASEALHSRRGIGFARGTAARQCVGTQDQDAAGTMVCTAGFRDDCVAMTLTSTPAADGRLDLDSITSDGFTLIVDDQGVVDLEVFWEAWGGDDITVAEVVSIAEPAATGNQDYTVTGFVSGATDQVVMFAGVHETGASPAASRQASSLCVGFASSGTAADNVVVVGSQDDASTTADTDGYCKTGECLAAIVAAGGNPDARAQLTQFGTNNFRLNWIARATTNRRYIALAIKGGNWKAGAYTIEGNSGGATATVSALPFRPIGISLIGRRTAEQAAGTASAQDSMGLGSGSSTSSRRSMGHLSENATGSSAAEINLCIEYDQVLSFPSTAGALLAAYDINAMNADGFQIVVDTAGGVASEWQGYLAFGIVPLSVNVSDSDVAEEAVTVDLTTLPLSVNVFDNTPATESVTVAIGLPALAVDSVSVAEAVTVSIPMQVVVDDIDSGTESVAVVVNPLTLLVSDTDTLTDEINVSFGQPFGFESFSDSVIAEEFVSLILGIPAFTVFDVVAGNDAVTVQIPMQVVVSDVDSATEAVTVAIPMAVLVFDDDVATELGAVTVNPLTMFVVDDDVASELTTATIQMAVVIFDSNAVAESVDIQRSPLLVDIADDDVGAEAIDVEIPMSAVVADEVTATEAVAVTVNPLVPAVVDDSPQTELVAVTVNPLVPAVADDVLADEMVAVQISVMVVVTETVGEPTEFVLLELNPVLVSVVDDSLGSDVAELTLNPVLVVVSDDAPAVEVVQVTMVVGGTIVIVVSDDAQPSEAVSVVVNPLVVLADDAVSVTEAVAVVVNPITVMVDDSTPPTESVLVVGLFLQVFVFDAGTSDELVDLELSVLGVVEVMVADASPGAESVQILTPYTIVVSEDGAPGEFVQLGLSGLSTPLLVSTIDSLTVLERRSVLSEPMDALYMGNAKMLTTAVANARMEV